MACAGRARAATGEVVTVLLDTVLSNAAFAYTSLTHLAVSTTTTFWAVLPSSFRISSPNLEAIFGLPSCFLTASRAYGIFFYSVMSVFVQDFAALYKSSSPQLRSSWLQVDLATLLFTLFRAAFTDLSSLISSTAALTNSYKDIGKISTLINYTCRLEAILYSVHNNVPLIGYPGPQMV